MVKVVKFTFNPFQENTYIIHDETGECVIIDPGCFTREEEKELTNYIEQKFLKPVKLVNTHCHIDHVLGNAFVCDQYDLLPEYHALEDEQLKSVERYAEVYGFQGYAESPLAETYLQEGTQLEFGNAKLDILFVPGHAPGHIALYAKEEKLVISGDVLFLGSIGRTDLPKGDFATLEASIRNEMYSLPDDVVVYCGHGPETTIGQEKVGNPFVSVG